MIINRTAQFRKIVNSKLPEVTLISVQPIRDEIKALSEGISLLKIKLDRNTLPSFSSRQRHIREINSLKTEIEAKLQTIEGSIRNIIVGDKKMTEAIHSYFLFVLKEYALRFRSLHKTILKAAPVYSPRYGQAEVAAESPLQLMIKRSSKIQESVLTLSNTLMELKMALKQQGEVIDRIDTHFEKSNIFLEGANKEIMQMPRKLTKYKDYIIYFMMYLICVLLILSVVKMLRESHS